MVNANVTRYALFVASIGTGCAAAALLAVNAGALYAVACGVVTFALIYWLTFYLLKRYVNERLDAMYRVITNNAQSDTGMPANDALMRANTDLQTWEETRNQEIERLRNNDLYRKEFVANVTHELKTPLFSIEGYVHSLLDGALEDSTVNRNFLNKAARNIERLVTLVSDLETLTQLETGGVTIKPEVFDIAALAHEAIESLELKASARNRKMILVNGKPVYVFADKEKIQQVLTNLVENSIKYGNEAGTTRIVFHDAGADVLIEVSDDGPGISSEHLPRLFERFYRVDKSRSREIGGTGLGLSIVKHIIEAHGKNIHVKSASGTSTVFTFSLQSR